MAAASAEATASKTAATLSAAEATAAGRGGLMLGAHGAGTGMAAIRAGGIPQAVDEYVAGAEAAGIAVVDGGPGHEEDHQNEYHEYGEYPVIGIVGIVIGVVAPAVIRQIIPAVLPIQGGGPAGIFHGEVNRSPVHIAGGEHMVSAGLAVGANARHGGWVVHVRVMTSTGASLNQPGV